MKKFATMVLLCSVAGVSPALAQDKTVIDGYYCESAAYEIVDTSGTCEEPAYRDPETDQCISSFIGTDYLKTAKTEDGNLDFSLFLNYTGGNSCGLEGTAQKIDENTWHFEKNLIEGDSSPGANCSITITYSQDGVKIVSPNENATCQYTCGMRGNLISVEFPMATKAVFDEAAFEKSAQQHCARPALGLNEAHMILK